MRRLSIPAAAVLIAANLSCALIRPRPAPYPEGLVFPLAAAEEAEIEGIPRTLAAGQDDRIFAVVGEGRILGLDSAKGGILWIYDAGHPLGEGLAVSSGRMFAVDEAGAVHAVDAGGNPAWKTAVDGRISTEAALFQDLVCIGTEEGRVIALEALGEGRVAWMFETGSPVVSGPEALGNRMFFATEDGRLHALDPSGRLLWSEDAGGRPVGPLLISGSMAFYGTEDRTIRGFDLELRRPRWGMKVGGHVAARPLVRDNTLYVLTTEGVLYGMMAHRGDIRWWRPLPSRSVFGLVLAGDNVFVSCRSPLLTAFNAQTGQKAGEFKFSEELVSEALWLDPRMVVSIQGPEESGRLVILEKDVRLSLTANKISPQEPGQEITFSVTPVGFHLPRYTFFLRTGTEERKVVQAESDRSTLAWFPDREGSYTIEVLVKDERQLLEEKMEYEVKKKAEEKKETKEKKS